MDNSLKEVWDKYTLKEIIDAGFELNKCSDEELLNAFNHYELTEEDCSLMEEMSLEDMMDAILQNHKVSAVVDTLDIDDVLDCIDNRDMIDYLDGTYEMDRRDDDIKEDAHNDGYNEGWDDASKDWQYAEGQRIDNFMLKTPEQMYNFFTSVFNISNYDYEGFKKSFESLKEKLNNSIYLKEQKI